MEQSGSLDEHHQETVNTIGTGLGAGNEEQHDHADDIVDAQEGRSRKRVRNPTEWAKNQRKRLRNSGQEYASTSKKTVKGKQCTVTLHKCRMKCDEKVSAEEQKSIFTEFWKLGTWDLQTQFISGSVHVSSVKRHRPGSENAKTTTRAFYLADKKVCKTFFLQVLGISQGRLQRCIERKTKNSGVGLTDRRGRHSPFNKTADDKMQFVKDHIKSFPKYHSHYSRKQNPNKQYLSPSLDLAKMYKLYKAKCEELAYHAVSEWVYRNTFNTKFNLSFHRPYTDTCQHCDRMKTQIDASEGEEKRKLENEKELHLRKAEKVITDKKTAVEMAQKNSKVHVITFDLQKTLPCPMLTTNVVFYKRQLWCYNLGVHDVTKHASDMFMWHEATAKRGAQEVGSCILKYVLRLPSTVEHLIAYTDTCGGQNRNEKIAKMFMYIVQNTHIQQIDHKFFESGHSFNECDADFAVIEKAKKKDADLYVPEDWMDLISKCRPGKFVVHRMITQDFVSIENMSKVTTVRKKDIDGESLNWLKLKWLRFSKAKPLRMQFKYTLNEETPFRELNFDKKLKRTGKPNLPTELSQLYDAPVPIKAEKLKDLSELLQFIPTPHHAFYKTLRSESGEGNEDPGIDDYESE